MEFEYLNKMTYKSLQQKALVISQVTANYVSFKLNKFMAEYDLSMAQFNILRILRGAKKELTINTVKDRMIEKSPNTTRLLDKLLEKGLIEKTCCEEDRRQFFIKITKQGKSLLRKIDKSEFEDLVSPSGLTDEEAEMIILLMKKVRNTYIKL